MIRRQSLKNLAARVEQPVIDSPQLQIDIYQQLRRVRRGSPHCCKVCLDPINWLQVGYKAPSAFAAVSRRMDRSCGNECGYRWASPHAATPVQ